MKTKFIKMSLGVAASVAMLSAVSSVHAQADFDQGFVPNPFDGYWMDPYGKCIRTPYPTGDGIPEECGGVTPIAVAEPVIEIISLGADAFFDFDKATLKPAGEQRLDELAGQMRRAKTIEDILIVGNTDSIGSEAYNQKLSLRRADTVRNYLADKGVSTSLMTVRGDGENNPIAPNTIDGRDNPAGRAENRRVDITVEAREEVLR